MFKSNTHIVAIAGDLHANSTVALFPPSFTLDEGGTHYPSKYQGWLWDNWLEYWQEVGEAKRKHRAKLTIIINGEVVDDNHHPTTQLVTRNDADIVRLGARVMEPATKLLGKGDTLVITRGTEAHTGPNACMDEMVAKDLGALPSMHGGDGEPSHYSWWHFRGVFEGVLIDVAHHPGTGHRLPWTKGGDANRLATRLMMQAVEFDQPIPHLAVRGHNHRDADSFDNHRTRGMILPSWQLGNAFGHRLGGDWLKAGAIYVICKGGEYEVKKCYKNWPVDDIWRA